jgi:hypothetical protein
MPGYAAREPAHVLAPIFHGPARRKVFAVLDFAAETPLTMATYVGYNEWAGGEVR